MVTCMLLRDGSVFVMRRLFLTSLASVRAQAQAVRTITALQVEHADCYQPRRMMEYMQCFASSQVVANAL
jgi:hypothetical protein